MLPLAPPFAGVERRFPLLPAEEKGWLYRLRLLLGIEFVEVKVREQHEVEDRVNLFGYRGKYLDAAAGLPVLGDGADGEIG
ncbi:MAG: hypothetical protein WKG07_23880 [Hymenobacter sp.]